MGLRVSPLNGTWRRGWDFFPIRPKPTGQTVKIPLFQPLSWIGKSVSNSPLQSFRCGRIPDLRFPIQQSVASTVPIHVKILSQFVQHGCQQARQVLDCVLMGDSFALSLLGAISRFAESSRHRLGECVCSIAKVDQFLTLL